jgi:hypothetical protein
VAFGEPRIWTYLPLIIQGGRYLDAPWLHVMVRYID